MRWNEHATAGNQRASPGVNVCTRINDPTARGFLYFDDGGIFQPFFGWQLPQAPVLHWVSYQDIGLVSAAG